MIDVLTVNTHSLFDFVCLGVVKSASSYAMFGNINVRDKGLHIPKIDPKNIRVCKEHFDLALKEVTYTHMHM